MQKPNTIENYFSKDECSRPKQIKVINKENIYQTALKRKIAIESEKVCENLIILTPRSKCSDERDEIIKRQNLQIEELQAKNVKFKKTQTEMLKMLHNYRLQILRFEKGVQSMKQTKPAALSFNDEITEYEQREHFSDSDLVALNSVAARKSSDRAYGRKLFEFLYRDNLVDLPRTLSSSSRIGKQPITPKKLEIMKKMLSARGKKCTDEVEQIERIASTYINGILSDALYAVKNSYVVT